MKVILQPLSSIKVLLGHCRAVSRLKLCTRRLHLGRVLQRELTKNEFSALADELRFILDSKKVLSYTRMKKGKDVFHSSAYRKESVRNSYTVLYRFGENTNFGQILYFFQYKASCPGTGSYTFNCTCLAFN